MRKIIHIYKNNTILNYEKKKIPYLGIWSPSDGLIIGYLVKFPRIKPFWWFYLFNQFSAVGVSKNGVSKNAYNEKMGPFTFVFFPKNLTNYAQNAVSSMTIDLLKYSKNISNELAIMSFPQLKKKGLVKKN